MTLDLIKDILKSKGYMVAMGSEYCEKYLANNPTCHDCESEQGCGRMNALAILSVEAMMDRRKLKTFDKNMRKVIDPDTSWDKVKEIVRCS